MKYNIDDITEEDIRLLCKYLFTTEGIQAVTDYEFVTKYIHSLEDLKQVKHRLKLIQKRDRRNGIIDDLINDD